MDTPLFERSGQHLHATALTAGPWDPAHCHGGATSALLAHLLEAVPSLVPMETARLSVELLRTVTRDPITATTHIVREGKRVQVVRAALLDEAGDELACATSLRIRSTHLALPDVEDAGGSALGTAPEELPRFTGNEVWQSGFFEAADLRVVGGTVGDTGPAAAWVRLLAPVIDDEPAAPLARTAAAADFGNGISAPLPMGDYVFINPDLTLHLARLPVGPWVGIDASSQAGAAGIGLTSSVLADGSGQIGTAAQSLYVAAR